MRKYTYFKRYRMEVDLLQPPAALAAGLQAVSLPPGFDWQPWHDSLHDAHAEVKALSFQDETDAIIFPCLGSLAGCRDLMRAIRERPGFCPRATWLVESLEVLRREATGIAGASVATVQGAIDAQGFGAIQNVGVVPEYRGRGLGRALMLQALAGFVACGARRAFLEVTARNGPAMRMYRAMGFRCHRTVYRAVRMPEPIAVGL